MPQHSSKKHESMESSQHEMSESSSPEDETHEGTEDSECCVAKAGKPKCSACAAGKPCSGKRGDSLTSQEYLRAIDLGIQDRPITYIRGRLDAMATTRATRKDLRAPGGKGKKCGNSYIPASATCNNGGGGSTLRKVGTAAAIAGGVAAAAYGASRMRRGSGRPMLPPAGGTANLARNTMGNRARRAAYNMTEGVRSTSFTKAGSVANRARRLRQVNVGQTASNAMRGARRSVRGAGQAMGSAVNSARFATRAGKGFTAGGSVANRARQAMSQARTYGAGLASVGASARSTARSAFSRRPMPLRRRGGGLTLYGRRDSVWADGFTMDPMVFAS